MRKEKQFSVFGVNYRTKQFSAVEGLRLLAIQEEIRPVEMLSLSQVKVGGKWTQLDEETINNHVADTVGLISPLATLKVLISLVHDHNFGFLNGWTGVKVPTRFQTGFGSVNSSHADPMVATVTGKDKATLRELEEYYNTEDIFKMFDMLVASGVNEARSNEEAQKAAKKR